MLEEDALLPFFFSFLGDREEAVRHAAGDALAQFKPRGELLLTEGLLKDGNAVVRSAAAWGLSHAGPQSFRALVLALGDSNDHVRKAACRAISTATASDVISCLSRPPWTTSQRSSLLRYASDMAARLPASEAEGLKTFAAPHHHHHPRVQDKEKEKEREKERKDVQVMVRARVVLEEVVRGLETAMTMTTTIGVVMAKAPSE